MVSTGSWQFGTDGIKTGIQGAVNRVRNPVSHPVQLMMIYLIGSQHSTFNGGLVYSICNGLVYERRAV